jgi:hypothetical protein
MAQVQKHLPRKCEALSSNAIAPLQKETQDTRNTRGQETQLFYIVMKT